MNRRIHHLLKNLLIFILFIIVIYSIFTAYYPIKDRFYSRKSYKYEKKIKTQTNNDEQVNIYLLLLFIYCQLKYCTSEKYTKNIKKTSIAFH